MPKKPRETFIEKFEATAGRTAAKIGATAMAVAAISVATEGYHHALSHNEHKRAALVPEVVVAGNGDMRRAEREEIPHQHVSYGMAQRTPGRAGSA